MMAGFLFTLVFIEELCRARKCNLVDVFIDLFFGHSDASVPDGEGLGFFVANDLDGGVAFDRRDFSKLRQCVALLRCIDCVRYQFPQEYLVIAVQEFLDDWKNVFRLDIDVSSCHGFRFVCLW